MKTFKYIIPILVAVLFIFLFYNGNRLFSKISELKGQNEILKKNNQAIFKEIKEMEDSIANNNKKINTLNNKDIILNKEYEVIQNEINNITENYEKASTYSINYTSDSIRWYFSNLK